MTHKFLHWHYYYHLFNSVGTIDDNAIQRFGVLTKLSKIIHKKNPSTIGRSYANGRTSNTSIQQIFPKFLWVVRDFVLQLKNEKDETISPDEYLEMAISKNEKSLDSNIVAKNEIKDFLSKMFVNRKCITLVRPISDEKKLQNIGSVSNDEIRSEFTKGVDYIRDFLFDSIEPKKFNGSLLNGRMFVSLIKNYCSALNKGVIVVDSYWENAIKTECNYSFIESKRFYKSQILKFIGEGNIVRLEKFEKIHKEISALAISKFSSKVVSKEEKKIYLRELRSSLGKEYEKFKMGLRKASNNFCNNILEEMRNDLENKVRNGKYHGKGKKTGFEEYIGDIKYFFEKYNVKGKGQEKESVLLRGVGYI